MAEIKTTKSSKKEFTKEVYQKLMKAVDALPKEAIETAKKQVTRKGYDTTGYQYQFLINVLNEVVSPACWSFRYETIKELQGTWSTGKVFWEITVQMTIEVLGSERTCVGGHKSEMHADAMKGAITNSFKKTVSLFGVGKKAYEGTIDDDYRPIPVGNVQSVSVNNSPNVPQKETVNSQADQMKKIIVDLCHKIDMNVEQEKNYKDFVLNTTQLELIPKNFKNIIGRLEIMANPQ